MSKNPSSRKNTLGTLYDEEENKDTRLTTITGRYFQELEDDEYCPATNFTGRQKKQLWISWKIMTGQDDAGLRKFGVLLTGWILFNCPEYKRVYDMRMKKYSRSYTEAKFGNALVDHVNTLNFELDSIMRKMPFPHSLNTYMQIAGNAHDRARKSASGMSYYRTFQVNFKKFVNVQLRGKMSRDVILLWTNLIDLLGHPRRVSVENLTVTRILPDFLRHGEHGSVKANGAKPGNRLSCTRRITISSSTDESLFHTRETVVSTARGSCADGPMRRLIVVGDDATHHTSPRASFSTRPTSSSVDDLAPAADPLAPTGKTPKRSPDSEQEKCCCQIM